MSSRDREGGRYGGRDRDRDRDGGRDRGRDRHRERDMDKDKRVNRDISSSRERSRERERRRRRAQAECIARAGGFQKLADSEGREPVRLFWDGFQWVAKTGHSQTLQNDPALMNSTRKMRRLYFGNLPLHLGLTETAFQDVVWQEMRTRGYCSNPEENPVLYVWFAKDKGNYGFAEFASVDETERALTMDGMTCMGIPLKVSRPNDYTTSAPAPGTATSLTGVAPGSANAMALMGQQAAAQMLMGVQPSAVATLPPSLTTNPTNGPPPGTTKCLKLQQVVRVQTLDKGEDELPEILEDVEDGCRRHGNIVFSHIVVTSDMKDAPEGSLVADVYLEYSGVEEADTCLRMMAGRKYEGRCLFVYRIEQSVMDEVIKKLPTAKKVG